MCPVVLELIDGVADCLDNIAGRFALDQVTHSGRFFVHGGVQGDQGHLLTIIKGVSQPLEEIMAGCRHPEETIPVTPDSVFVIAGLMANELFNNLCYFTKVTRSFPDSGPAWFYLFIS
jgi:molybdopterin/thiamine biosynthesis adenylyltransferase